MSENPREVVKRMKDLQEKQLSEGPWDPQTGEWYSRHDPTKGKGGLQPFGQDQEMTYQGLYRGPSEDSPPLYAVATLDGDGAEIVVGVDEDDHATVVVIPVADSVDPMMKTFNSWDAAVRAGEELARQQKLTSQQLSQKYRFHPPMS